MRSKSESKLSNLNFHSLTFLSAFADNAKSRVKFASTFHVFVVRIHEYRLPKLDTATPPYLTHLRRAVPIDRTRGPPYVIHSTKDPDYGSSVRSIIIRLAERLTVLQTKYHNTKVALHKQETEARLTRHTQNLAQHKSKEPSIACLAKRSPSPPVKQNSKPH
jgi:hypothetical protein